MKLLTSVFVFSIFAMTNVAHAIEIDPKKAHRAMRALSSSILSIEGVSGIRVTSCSAEAETVSYCINIRAETENSYTKLIELFPPGTKKNGSPIVIDPPCPRMSAGT